MVNLGAGKQVRTLHTTSMPEVIRDAAILVNPKNVAEITDAMSIIAKNEGERSRLSTLSLASSSRV